jgi:hypothetical protein
MQFSAILKLINIWFLIFFYRQYKKKEEKKVEDEILDIKDINTWYSIDNGSAQYKGQWKNGKPNGKGVMEIFKGKCASCHTIIECNFVDGNAEGYGKQFYDQDEGETTQPYYEGEFHSGLHHGQGTYNFGTGKYYKGNFKQGKFHGVGYECFDGIDEFWIGEYENDKLIKSMRASESSWTAVANENTNDVDTWYIMPNDKQTRYKGEWKNGLPDGKGVKEAFATNKRDYYITEGNFVNGNAEGHGKQTFKQTHEKIAPYYEGEFKNNKYNGMGEYNYGDGVIYKGEFKNGMCDGDGVEYCENKKKIWVGVFRDDKKVNGKWI